MQLILASSSPRRHDLLMATGLPFVVAHPDIDETPRSDESPADYVQRLSLEKARAIASDPTNRESLILSADTTVVDGRQIIGKPENAVDAIDTLRRLRGRSHEVHTGVTVLDVATGRHITRLTTSQVIMRDLTDQEIAAYVASGDPMGKAGSYAIQNAAFHPVDHLDGCYTNVVGLPLCTVCQLLASFGLQVPLQVACSPTNLPCQLNAIP